VHRGRPAPSPSISSSIHSFGIIQAELLTLPQTSTLQYNTIQYNTIQYNSNCALQVTQPTIPNLLNFSRCKHSKRSIVTRCCIMERNPALELVQLRAAKIFPGFRAKFEISFSEQKLIGDAPRFCESVSCVRTVL
jgi:hypothetical protein